MSLLKKLSYSFRLATITALFGAVIVAFLIPVTVQAQTAGPAPRGQVLQATTGACPATQTDVARADGLVTTNAAFNGLTVSINPQNAPQGGSVSVNYAVSEGCRDKLGTANNFTLLTFHSALDVKNDDTNRFSTQQAKPAAGSFSMPLTSSQFAPGDHKVVVAVLSQQVEEQGNRTLIYNNYIYGEFVVKVDAASGTGGPTLTSTQTTSGAEPITGKPYYEFTVSYLAGGSGKDIKSVTVNCGGGVFTGTNPVSYSSGQAIRCVFDLPTNGQPKNYTVTFQALDAAGQPITGALATSAVTVTGKESNSTVTGQNTGIASANPVVAFINFVVGSVLKFFIAAMGAAVGIIGTMLESVLSIRTFSDEFANVIYPAWEIFRNLGNIFFILAIVAIGVATVFRISGYAVKDLLVKLILGAILINFSLTIAQAVLGISDTLQQQFLSDRSGAVRAIVNTLFVNNIWYDTPANQLGDFSETIRIVTQFFIAFAAFFAILAIAILVCVRVVMLWLLLMLSPIPYVAMILPTTRKFSSQWWDAFINWALVTPAVGFMLNLTALMTTKNATVIQDLTAKGQLAVNESWLNNATFALARNVIPLIFLYMTLKVATSFGKGAGGFVTKSLNKVSGMAFAPAAALGGYAAGVATSTGNFAKNVGKAPLVLAQQKLAEGKADREARIQGVDKKPATASDYLFNALSMPSKLNQILDAKVKRGEGNVKDAQKKYGELMTDWEKRKYSWDGTKALGNRIKLGAKELWAVPQELAERSQVKTSAELNDLIQKGMTDSTTTEEENKNAIEKVRIGSGRIAYDQIEKQLQSIEGALKSGGGTDEQKAELETRKAALNEVLSDKKLKEQYLSELAPKGAKDVNAIEEDKVVAFKKSADAALKELKALELKSEYAPSFLADKYRRANTKGAASKLPEEYVYGEVVDFARKAFAKGDTYGALAAVEQMQKEGNTKDLLKEFGYGDTAEDLRKFFKDKFGGMGDDTVIKLLRESDKYAKSSGAWDLAGKIKYDEKARKYVEVEETKRIAKSLKDKIGEGSVDVLWRQLTGKVAFATGADGKSKLSQTYVDALKQIPFDDPRAVQKFMNMHNGPTAKAVTVLGEQFKTTEEFNNAQQQLKEALGEEHYNQVFRLLQYQSGVMPKVLDPATGAVDEAKTKAEETAIMDEVKNVNAKVTDLKKAAKADKGQGGAGQNPQGNSKQNRKKNNGGNSSNPQSGPQPGNSQGGGQSGTYRGGGGGMPFVR